MHKIVAFFSCISETNRLTMEHWKTALKNLLPVALTTQSDRYLKTNIETIRSTLKGQGPHSSRQDPNQSMQLVFNLSARHAVSFLDVRSKSPGRGCYLNRVAVSRLAGKPLTGATVRERVDRIVSRVAKSVGRSVAPTDIYFGAAELNGSGIAYFGDICLVLKSDEVPAGLLSLLRNSYDLTVAPVFQQIYVKGSQGKTESEAVSVMTNWAGTWPDETRDMAVVKLLQYAPPSERRLTTGQISNGVLSDEDYIEIVYEKSFSPKEVREIRLSPTDVAREARIADRTMRGPSPSAADMLWRYRRRLVERNAKWADLTCRVVAHSGRSRA